MAFFEIAGSDLLRDVHGFSIGRAHPRARDVLIHDLRGRRSFNGPAQRVDTPPAFVHPAFHLLAEEYADFGPPSPVS